MATSLLDNSYKFWDVFPLNKKKISYAIRKIHDIQVILG